MELKIPIIQMEILRNRSRDMTWGPRGLASLVFIQCTSTVCSCPAISLKRPACRFLIRDYTYMSREHGGGVRTGPSGGLQNWGRLILTRVRRTMGEKDIPMREERRQKRSFFWGESQPLCGLRCRHWGRKRGRARAPPECESLYHPRVVCPEQVALPIWASPFCLTLWYENPRYCRIDMRLNEIMHMECLRREGLSIHSGFFCESPTPGAHVY